MIAKEQTYTKDYGSNRIFKAGVMDILRAPVDVIVNPANGGLSHGGGLAAIISEKAGPGLDEECQEMVQQMGRIPVTLGAPTGAYHLPYKGIIHMVGPQKGEGDERGKLERTVINALLIAEKKEWQSVAFPAISTGIFGVSKQICAEAFKNAIPEYWEKSPNSCVSFVFLCLTTDDFDVFYHVLNQ